MSKRGRRVSLTCQSPGRGRFMDTHAFKDPLVRLRRISVYETEASSCRQVAVYCRAAAGILTSGYVLMKTPYQNPDRQWHASDLVKTLSLDEHHKISISYT